MKREKEKMRQKRDQGRRKNKEMKDNLKVLSNGKEEGVGCKWYQSVGL